MGKGGATNTVSQLLPKMGLFVASGSAGSVIVAPLELTVTDGTKSPPYEVVQLVDNFKKDKT